MSTPMETEQDGQAAQTQSRVAVDRAAGLPATARALFDRANTALRQGRGSDVQADLDGLASLAPQHPEVLRLIGIGHYQAARYGQAVDLFEQALERRPDDALLYGNLGSALGMAGNATAALAAFRRSTELAPQLAEPWFVLGNALELQGDSAAAREAFGRVLERQPAHLPAQFLVARIAQRMGDIDETEARYRAIIAAHPRSAQAWFGLSQLKTVRFSASELDAMQALYAHTSLDEKQRIQLGFALNKAFEDHARYAEAFAMLGVANAAKRRQLRWDASAFSREVDATLQSFAAPIACAADSALGSGIVFIISMARSGSSLVEQMFAAHPDIAAAGELVDLPNLVEEESARRQQTPATWTRRATASDWQRLGEAYLQRTARHRDPRRGMTDKGLSNWLHVGAAMAMLPGARFIEVRRDALETCLACYRQLFSDTLQPAVYDLVELAAYRADYERATDAWIARCSDRIARMNYEDLLASPESELRRVLEFCGLPWDAACLDFHTVERDVRTASAAQVRQPLRGNTARASRYGELLSPLRRALDRSAQRRTGACGA